MEKKKPAVEIPRVILPKEPEGGGEKKEEPGKVFQLMERRDEQQIVDTLMGRYIDEFVYEFREGDRKVVGLSWLGIQEASREYGGIKCRLMEKKEADEYIEVVIEATDTRTNASRIGVKRQPKKMSTRKGVIEDKFAMEKAVAKAQRNAIRPLLPQTLMKMWIEKHRKGGKTEKRPPASSPEDGGGRITQPQMKLIYTEAGKKNLNEEQLHALIKKTVGVSSVDDLSKKQASEIISQLKA